MPRKLDARMEAKRVLVGTRRLGERKARENPRPLLLIFKLKEDRDFLLGRAPRLSRETDIYWRDINIVADLTKKQRDKSGGKWWGGGESDCCVSTSSGTSRKSTRRAEWFPGGTRATRIT